MLLRPAAQVPTAERVGAAAVASGLRLVLASEPVRCQYVYDSPSQDTSFTLAIAGVCTDGSLHAILTHERVSQGDRTHLAALRPREAEKDRSHWHRR